MGNVMGTEEITPGRAYRAMVVMGAVLAAAAVWFGARALGEDIVIDSPAVGRMAVPLLLVVGSALAAALMAWGILAVIERFARRPARTWAVTAWTGLALSLPPLLFLHASAACVLVLALMHVASGLVLILLLRGPHPQNGG